MTGALLLPAALAAACSVGAHAQGLGLGAPLVVLSDELPPNSPPATAADRAPNDPAKPDQLSGGARPERFLLFSGIDLWHSGVTGYGALQWAPRGLEADGMVLRVAGSDAIERFRTPAQTFTTNTGRAALLGGRHWREGAADLTVLVGFDLMSETAGGGIAPFRHDTTRLGMRAAAELWIEPSRETMLAASAYVTTIDAGSGGRVAAGWRVLDLAWVGPEATLSRDDFNTQHRLGAHLTGLRPGDTEWSLAGGYVGDSFGRSGAYGRLGVSMRR